jgi:hypothetical protein
LGLINSDGIEIGLRSGRNPVSEYVPDWSAEVSRSRNICSSRVASQVVNWSWDGAAPTSWP